MYDIKLKDGRYLSDVNIVDIYNDYDEIYYRHILVNPNKKVRIVNLQNKTLCKVTGSDIEYCCKAYGAE